MAKFVRRPKRIIKRPGACYFCKQKLEPDYKVIDTLKRSVSERGKIIGRRESGVCQKHQHALAECVKRARYMALFPYIVRPS